MQNKTLRAKSYRVLKTYIFDYFLNLDYKQQAAYLIGFGAIGVAGGTASYAWHSLQDPTKVTNKFAPLDPAEIDIISHEYMAMATLQYSCSLYDQKMLLSTQPTMTIAEVKSQVWQLEQVVKRQNFLNNNTYFQNKVFVPKNSISYNDGTNNVQLDLTVQNLHFVEKFKCDKYEGIGDQRLQVNLEETMLDAADVYLELLKRYQVLFAEDKSRGAKAK